MRQEYAAVEKYGKVGSLDEKCRNSRRCDDGDPVVVLGGGVMGLSTAWSLARSGVKVTRQVVGQLGGRQLIGESGPISRI